MEFQYQLVQGIYVIPNYEALTNECKAFIDNQISFLEPKKARASINKALDSITTFRRNAVKAQTKVLSDQCKELEKMLSEASSKLTEEINKDLPPKPEVFTITCDATKRTLDKAMKALEDLGLSPKYKAK